MSGFDVAIDAIGLDHHLAELGEQLAWLGAACRASPVKDKFAIISTEISTDKKGHDLMFEITYSSKNLKMKGDMNINGSCWRSMFKNPAIVKGFPILVRSNGERGLEIPLNMMAGLGMTDQVITFGNGLVLKGFSSMFVPVKCSKESVQWHFIFNEDISNVDEGRISYLEADKRCSSRLSSEALDSSFLEAARHIVGWSSSVEMLTGKY